MTESSKATIVLENTINLNVRRIERTYVLLCLVFALGYGLYAGFESTFLAQRFSYALTGSNSASTIFSNLLLVITVLMLAEAAFGPLAGWFADRYGRRTAFIAGLATMISCFALYALASTSLIKNHSSIIGLALFAEILMAGGYAFRSGSLEAWVVDTITPLKPAHDFRRLFARQWQVFTIGLTAGGVVSMTYATARGDLSMIRPKAVFGLEIWLAAAALLAIDSLMAFAVMDEFPSEEIRSNDKSPRMTFRTGISELRSNSRLLNLLGLSSVLYASFVVFMYFHPILWRRIPPNGAVLTFIAANYQYAFLLLGVIRILGPAFTVRLSRRGNEARTLSLLGIIHGISLLLGGVSAVLAGKYFGNASDIFAVIGIGLLYIAKFIEEGIKPLRSAAMNARIHSASVRAFVLSLVTPGGALLVFVGSIAALLISGTINPAGAALPESMSSLWIMVAMVFIIAGVLTTITSIVLSRHERDVEQKDISAERIVTAIDI